MTRNSEFIDRGERATFDYIVIGAGPAGCVAAARLAQSSSSTSVALIEAGPAKASLLSDVPAGIYLLLPRRSRRNYAYETVPQPGFNGRKGYQPRGRGLGGSSLINAMIYTRGQRQDYESWAALGCKGWAFADVLPYFKRSEDNARGADALHGAGGPLHVSDLSYRNPAVEAFVQAAVEAGFKRNDDFNGETQEGVGPYQVFQKNGRRYNAARAYLQTSPAPNLAIFSNSQARRILFEGRRAVGVAYRRGAAEERLYARREVVLSCGAFGSPQLLMVSGVGSAAHLKSFGIDVVHDAPEVGANLQDHCDYIACLRAAGPGLFGVRPALIENRPCRARQLSPSWWRNPDDQCSRGRGLHKKRPRHRAARPAVALLYCNRRRPQSQGPSWDGHGDACLRPSAEEPGQRPARRPGRRNAAAH